ncbi:MFS general substrate transporter [Apiospora kogelbergensis]|uniref:MFS general substrate transporter n=1 Tax=Apiospora kogelbergensis TaxID=1337665 RepID=A0AAW0QYP8_9PEZI
MFGFNDKKKDRAVPQQVVAHDGAGDAAHPIDNNKNFWHALFPIVACGAGLFSDGYVNNVIGSVSPIFAKLYGAEWTDSNAKHYVSDIAFAGTVVGMLIFGYTSDHWSRTGSLLVSTIILIIFTALAAASYWHGETIGMFNILTAWRFFVGIGIGGEYPAGSVACAESTGEMKSGTRNAWFILFTNSMIDWGFVFGAFVPYIVAAACHNDHLETMWRTPLGIGVVFPLVLFVLRLKLKEPEEFSRESMKNTKTPYWLVLRYYGFRLFVISAVWFLYDFGSPRRSQFSSYSFSLYSSTIVASIYGGEGPFTTVFGWNTVIMLFYIPGTMLGAPVSDRLGPRWTLIVGVTAQSIVGFIMAGCYAKLAQPSVVGAFAVVYGLFLSFGELGPGNNIGLLASKTCATGVRGQYYGIAAAVGKIGAFVGTWVFPYIQAAGGDDVAKQNQYPFYVSSSLCLLSAALVYFLVPEIGQDTITKEDADFRTHLESKGWDVRQLGLKKGESADTLENNTAPMPCDKDQAFASKEAPSR